MIVYGDPSFTATPAELAAHLRRRIGASGALPDDLRALLIEAGQAEQAAEDAGLPPDVLAALRAFTDGVANRWARSPFRVPEGTRCGAAPPPDALMGGESPSPGPEGLRREAPPSEYLQVLGTTRGNDTRDPLTIKVPEGFAFYALYPEQYAEAARRWAAERARESERTVAVVGVRSIGTTLSAVVAAELRRLGWDARRFTVRPTGHPYAREVVISPEQTGGAAWALVVDEGPGQSGSSMAAVVRALEAAGMAPGRVALLPGHGGEPGGAASPEIRAVWERTPRHVVPRDELRWAGRSLTEVLADETRALLGAPTDAPAAVDDLGGGLWRPLLFGADPASWPAAFPAFERPKYRVRLLSDGPAVLWAFCGLAGVAPGVTGAERAAARLAERARGGWTVAPLGTALGWLATPWVEGTPLTPADAHAPATLAHVGRYVAAVAGESLSPEEVEAGRARLAEMLYWNVWEGVGEGAAARVRDWSERVAPTLRALPAPLRAAYGDGRLAPHEWLRTPGGRLVKTDAAGHDADHTCVGRQPVLWDLGGALVEWGQTGHAANPAALLAGFSHAADMPPDALRWHAAAYAAFRLGQSAMCGVPGDAYRAALLALLP